MNGIREQALDDGSQQGIRPRNMQDGVEDPEHQPRQEAGQGQRHDPSGLTDQAQVEDQEQGNGRRESDQQDRGQEPSADR